MALKLTLVGMLLYGTMTAYVIAVAAYALRFRALAVGLSILGAVLGLVALCAQGAASGSLPLRSMFEVFLCLAVLAAPLAILQRRGLGIGLEWIDLGVALLLLVPAGFVFKATPTALPPILRFWAFGPHVLAYLLAYVLLFKGGVLGALHLLGLRPTPSRTTSQSAGAGSPAAAGPNAGALAGDGVTCTPPRGLGPTPDAAGETWTYADEAARLTRLAFPLLTLGLVLGAYWGKLAWGDYWNWDPKEMGALATWLLYGGLLVADADGAPRARPRAGLAVGGVGAIALTLLWVNLAPAAQSFHGYAN